MSQELIIIKDKFTQFKGDFLMVKNGQPVLVEKKFRLIVSTPIGKDIFIFSTYFVFPADIDLDTENNKIETELTIRFLIKNYIKISTVDLYDIVIQTKDQLQLIFDNIFFSEKDKLLVPTLLYDDIESDLIEIINKIK
jgi:hypothetical protein